MNTHQWFKIPKYCNGEGNVVYWGGWYYVWEDYVQRRIMSVYQALMALHIQFIFKLLSSIKHVRHDSSLAQSLPSHNIFIIEQSVGGFCRCFDRSVFDKDSNITQGLRGWVRYSYTRIP